MLNLENLLTLQRCPHCSVDSPNLIESTRFKTNSFDRVNPRTWAIYACRRCGGVITAWAYEGSNEVKEYFPETIELDGSIPAKARTFLRQSIDSLHAPSGAIMLAASSIDAMLKEKGYKEGNLFSRINQAAKEHLITNGMAEWAHEIRLDANDERHADDDAELPDIADAQRTVDFAISLAHFLFVMPSRVDRGLKDAKAK